MKPIKTELPLDLEGMLNKTFNAAEKEASVALTGDVESQDRLQGSRAGDS